MEDDNYYITLSKNPIRFEPVSKANNVFFDDANKQVWQWQMNHHHLLLSYSFILLISLLCQFPR